MTDNEIIGRLIDNASYSCDTCIFDNDECENEQCQMETAKAAVDLISRLKTKIEELEKGELSKAMTFNSTTIKRCVNEAVKEFAEKIKLYIGTEFNVSDDDFIEVKQDIDRLVKEME